MIAFDTKVFKILALTALQFIPFFILTKTFRQIMEGNKTVGLVIITTSVLVIWIILVVELLFAIKSK